MGLFSKKKKEVDDNLEKLKELGIDFFAYSHDDMEPVELTIDDELDGTAKISEKFDDDENVLFNYTSFTTKEDGTFELSLSRQMTDEREIRDKVNLISSVLGMDDEYNVDFDTEDLEKIRSGKISNIRTWSDNSGYTIALSCGNEILGLYIF